MKRDAKRKKKKDSHSNKYRLIRFIKLEPTTSIIVAPLPFIQLT